MRRFAFLAGRRLRRAAARVRAARQRRRLSVSASTLQAPAPLAAAAPPAVGGTLRIVAHQDDDLLFQSVSLQADVDEGHRMTTIYLTAGDDDDDEWYWRAREAGVRAAYAALLGVDDRWIDDVRTLAGTPVAQATLVDAPRVRLLFVRLPDGGIEGDGGARSGHSSLRRLWEGAQASMSTVDGTATHTLDGLVAMLGELVAQVGPERILSLDHVGTFGDGDHSDHHVVAYLAERVHAEAASTAVFQGYRGYTIERFPANLSAGQVAAKEAAFFAYAESDYKTCHTQRTCVVRPESLWMAREYEVSRVAA